MNLLAHKKTGGRFRPAFNRGKAGFTAAAVFLAFTIFSANAEEEAPGPDDKLWMSIERFTDKASRFPELIGERQEKQESPSGSETAAAKESPESAQENGGTKTAEEKKEQPEEISLKAMTLPLLPGINRGFDLHISSTNDEETAEAETADPKMFIAPTRKIQPPIMPMVNQSTSGESDGQETKAAADGEEQEQRSPLNIRFAKLPNSKFAVLSLPPVIKPKENDQSAARPAEKQKQETVSKQAQACEAPLVRRKRQLEAIESDRQTLKALQSAIAELGLDKELNFSRGAGGEVLQFSGQNSAEKNKPAAQTAPADMDRSASTGPRKTGQNQPLIFRQAK